jgi:ATP/ADP translocase
VFSFLKKFFIVVIFISSIVCISLWEYIFFKAREYTYEEVVKFFPILIILFGVILFCSGSLTIIYKKCGYSMNSEHRNLIGIPAIISGIIVIIASIICIYVGLNFENISK